MDIETLKQTDVEVELHELIDWGHAYETFSDMLRDKIMDVVEGGAAQVDGLDLDDPDYGSTVFVVDYRITSVTGPNTVMFAVTWELDT